MNISRTFTNTDVDEFLNLIKESNVSLESLNLLLNVYKDNVKVKGSGLHKNLKVAQIMKQKIYKNNWTRLIHKLLNYRINMKG